MRSEITSQNIHRLAETKRYAHQFYSALFPFILKLKTHTSAPCGTQSSRFHFVWAISAQEKQNEKQKNKK